MAEDFHGTACETLTENMEKTNMKQEYEQNAKRDNQTYSKVAANEKCIPSISSVYLASDMLSID